MILFLATMQRPNLIVIHERGLGDPSQRRCPYEDHDLDIIIAAMKAYKLMPSKLKFQRGIIILSVTHCKQEISNH